MNDFKLNGVLLENSQYEGQNAYTVTMPPGSAQDPTKGPLTDRANLAWLPVDFKNGTIEVDVAAVLAPDAPAFARGFIGVGFRISPDLAFESIYLRPANSRVDDQVRRNHSIQYFAYPDFDFVRLRKEGPEKYEAYTDIALGEWINMRIIVRDASARLYVNNGKQPSLIVTDMKLGPDHHGGVGFWIETGTIGHFRNLKISASF